jgi:hypothetical protein
MNTFVLNDSTAHLSIAHLLKQVQGGAVEVRDAAGKVVALVLSPADHLAWSYAEANLDLDQHRNDVQQALSRRGGVTTEQLLANAAAATRDAGR